jgi:hypothetical protein
MSGFHRFQVVIFEGQLRTDYFCQHCGEMDGTPKVMRTPCPGPQVVTNL